MTAVEEKPAVVPGGTAPPLPPRGARWPVVPVAVLSVLLIGLNRPIANGVTTAALPVALMLPVSLSAVAAFRYARVLLVLAAVALLGGACLTLISSNTYAVDQNVAITEGLLVLTAVYSVGVLLWVSRLIGIDRVALLYGLAVLLGAALDRAKWGENPWKFAFAFPTVVVVLALVSRTRRFVLQLVALGALGLVSVLLDHRSYFGFCVLTGVILIWQRIGEWRPPRHKAFSVVAVGAAGLAMYYGGTALLVDGALGPELQERSEAQIEASGSLLLGGRPEWSGTVQLMRLRPEGYGFGVIPGTPEVKAVKTGFAGINVQYDNGYVERYMLGGAFRLHSIVAETWAYCGVFGLVLCGAIALVLIGAFVTRFATRTGTPLFLFLAVLGLWDLAFGPSYSNWPDVTIALALALCPPAAAQRGRRARLASRRAFRVESRQVGATGAQPPSRRAAGVLGEGVADGAGDEAGAPGEGAGAAGPVLHRPGRHAGEEPQPAPADPDQTVYHLPNPYRERARET
jgi:hypothetical protein